MNMNFSFKYISGVFLLVEIGYNFGDRINKLKCQLQSDGMVEFVGSISNLQSDSLAKCSSDCLKDDKCVTFFYNIDTRQCVLHSKDFIYQPPSVHGPGWKHFKTTDVSGRCPTPYIYYRHLDFCYTVGDSPEITFPDIKQQCIDLSGKLAAVDSQQRQDYFDHFLSGRPYGKVCISGDVQTDGSILSDNSKQQVYSNWYPGEPNHPNQRCIFINSNGMWYDCNCIFTATVPCVFVCEFQ